MGYLSVQNSGLGILSLSSVPLKSPYLTGMQSRYFSIRRKAVDSAVRLLLTVQSMVFDLWALLIDHRPVPVALHIETRTY